jgi:DNA polymerase IV
MPERPESRYQLRSLFLDLNSFFASVEQYAQPELRGKPMSVLPVLADSTCCIAASIEAKKFGVKTGTGVKEARQLCPGIQFVVARHAEYVRIHQRILRLVESCVPIEAVCSIDEMSCRLNQDECEPDAAIVLAKRIKQKLKDEFDGALKCSIGLAPNRFLAKLATDMQKPDGLVVIGKCELPQRLFGQALTDFCGIGRRMHARLNRAGVYTVEDLCARSEKELEKIWGGVNGKMFWRWLQGEETPLKATRKSSVSHQHVLPRDLRTEEKARAVAVKLLHKTAARLRHIGYVAGGMVLSVGLQGQDTYAVQARFQPMQDTMELLTLLGQMWAQRPRGTPSFIDITLFDLERETDSTVPLFDGERRGRRLSRAIDVINQKFGRNTICPASMKGAEDAAPGGIAFLSVPDLKLADTVPERGRDGSLFDGAEWMA